MMTGSIRRIVCTTLLLVGLSACSSDNSSTPANESSSYIILTVIEAGGCQRLGPNCAVHTLYGDGKVTAARATSIIPEEQNSPIEVTAAIDVGLAQSWLMTVKSEDFDALRQSLPAGQCAGCLDGIDLQYLINAGTENIANEIITFNSLEHAFDTSHTFFAITADLYRAMQEAAPLELRSR